jgi:hypothetical protein
MAFATLKPLSQTPAPAVSSCRYLACICWLAACISGNDVLNELAQLTDNIADILWCS